MGHWELDFSGCGVVATLVKVLRWDDEGDPVEFEHADVSQHLKREFFLNWQWRASFGYSECRRLCEVQHEFRCIA